MNQPTLFTFLGKRKTVDDDEEEKTTESNNDFDEPPFKKLRIPNIINTITTPTTPSSFTNINSITYTTTHATTNTNTNTTDSIATKTTGSTSNSSNSTNSTNINSTESTVSASSLPNYLNDEIITQTTNTETNKTNTNINKNTITSTPTANQSKKPKLKSRTLSKTLKSRTRSNSISSRYKPKTSAKTCSKTGGRAKRPKTRRRVGTIPGLCSVETKKDLSDLVKASMTLTKWTIEATNIKVKMDCEAFRFIFEGKDGVRIIPSTFDENTDVVVCRLNEQSAGEVFGKSKIKGGSRIGTYTITSMDVVFLPKHRDVTMWFKVFGW